MLTYLTCNQLIIGLNSYHPIKRLIKEGNFKHIAFLYGQDEFNKKIPGTKKIVKVLDSCKIPFQQFALSMRANVVTLDKDVDLIISYGERYIHDIAKMSNTNACPLYTIEYNAGRMSSFGTGLL
jgi:hypothetical protein